MNKRKETVLAYLQTSMEDETQSLRALHDQRVAIYGALDAMYGPDEYEATEIADTGHPLHNPEAENLAKLRSLIALCEYDVMIVADITRLTRDKSLLPFIERMIDSCGTELVLCE